MQLRKELTVNIDECTPNQAIGIQRFLETCGLIENINLYSSLTKVHDVKELNEFETAECDKKIKTAADRLLIKW